MSTGTSRMWTTGATSRARSPGMMSAREAVIDLQREGAVVRHHHQIAVDEEDVSAGAGLALLGVEGEQIGPQLQPAADQDRVALCANQVLVEIRLGQIRLQHRLLAGLGK